MTIAFPEFLQIEMAFREASGLEKSIKTSKSWCESLRLSPLSTAAPNVALLFKLTASTRVCPIFPLDPFIAILVIYRIL